MFNEIGEKMILKKFLHAKRYTLKTLLLNTICCSLCIILIFVIGCATRSPLLEKPAGEYVWPTPPEIPRIKWLTQWSNSEDFKKINPLDVVIGEAVLHVLFRPNGVVADKEGNIYVADSQLHKIFVFDIENHTLRFIGEEILVTPISLGIDNKRGILFVSDTNLDKVFGLDKNTGKVVLSIGISKEFNNPTGIVYDEERERVYVSDTKNHIIRVYDKDGKPLFTIGKRGHDDGEFNTPNYLALDRNGRLYVVDSFNFRIQIFDPEGNFVKKFGRLGNTSGSFSRPAGIGVDSEGHIYVVDASFSNFQIFNDEGKLLLWIGKAGTGAGQFSIPIGMYIDSEDRIYITDTFNIRVQVFQYLKEKK